MALAGHVSRAMMERYSHNRMEAKRKAVDDLSGIEFEPGWAQKRAQFFLRDKPDQANSLIASRNAKYSMFQAVSPFRRIAEIGGFRRSCYQDVMKFFEEFLIES